MLFMLVTQTNSIWVHLWDIYTKFETYPGSNLGEEIKKEKRSMMMKKGDTVYSL